MFLSNVVIRHPRMVPVSSAVSSEHAPNFSEVDLLRPFIKQASDTTSLDLVQLDIPQCISPRPAGAAAMAPFTVGIAECVPQKFYLAAMDGVSEEHKD